MVKLLPRIIPDRNDFHTLIDIQLLYANLVVGNRIVFFIEEDEATRQKHRDHIDKILKANRTSDPRYVDQLVIEWKLKKKRRATIDFNLFN